MPPGFWEASGRLLGGLVKQGIFRSATEKGKHIKENQRALLGHLHMTKGLLSKGAPPERMDAKKPPVDPPSCLWRMGCVRDCAGGGDSQNFSSCNVWARIRFEWHPPGCEQVPPGENYVSVCFYVGARASEHFQNSSRQNFEVLCPPHHPPGVAD